MTVLFYSGFYKRKNSTKQPSGGTGFSVVLKENTSMMRPSFLVSTVDWSWNYAKWGARYYYIDDIVVETNNTFRVVCSLDILATFRADIGAYTTLISRASADQNYDVVETTYPAKARPVTKRSAITNPSIFSTNRANGTYIVGVIGSGGVKFYAMDSTSFFYFCNKLMPSLSAMTIDQWVVTQVTQAPVGGLSTILQNIIMIKWLPVAFSSIAPLTTQDTAVKVGNFEVAGFTGHLLSGGTTIQLLGTAINFPVRDDNGARGRWLYQAPFANYSVYIPPFGKLDIDATYMAGAGLQISADIMIEAISGNVTLRLYYALGVGGVKMIGVYNTNISQDLRIGGSSANVGGILSGVGGAMLAYSEEKWAGVVGGIASATGSAIPQTSSAGGTVTGPTPDLDANWYAYATYFDPIEENNGELGRPLAEVRQISSLGGFVKCADPKISIAGHEEEMSFINGALATGIFYE